MLHKAGGKLEAETAIKRVLDNKHLIIFDMTSTGRKLLPVVLEPMRQKRDLLPLGHLIRILVKDLTFIRLLQIDPFRVFNQNEVRVINKLSGFHTYILETVTLSYQVTSVRQDLSMCVHLQKGTAIKKTNQTRLVFCIV